MECALHNHTEEGHWTLEVGTWLCAEIIVTSCWHFISDTHHFFFCADLIGEYKGNNREFPTWFQESKSLFTLQALKLKSVLFWILSKQQFTNDQIGFVWFETAVICWHGYTSCHSNGRCVRSGFGWLVVVLLLPIIQKLCSKLRWQQCLLRTFPSHFECSTS